MVGVKISSILLAYCVFFLLSFNLWKLFSVDFIFSPLSEIDTRGSGAGALVFYFNAFMLKFVSFVIHSITPLGASSKNFMVKETAIYCWSVSCGSILVMSRDILRLCNNNNHQRQKYSYYKEPSLVKYLRTALKDTPEYLLEALRVKQ